MRSWRLRRVNWRQFCDRFQQSRERNWTGSSTRSLVAESAAIIPWQSPAISTGSTRRELFWNLPRLCCGGISEEWSLRRGRRGQIRRSSSSNVRESNFCCATTRNGRENLATLRPVLGAKKQLVFMSPRMVGNEPAPYHPFRDRIQSLIDGNLPIFDLDRHLADPDAAPAWQLVAPRLHAFPRRGLPGIRRWWKLSSGQHLDSRDLESFSSAQKFIFNPSAWVLRYKAKLRTGRLFGNDITCGVRQRGNLLHRLIEIIFAPGSSVDWKTASREQVEQWLEDEWRKLLPAEGANLLLPGNRVALLTGCWIKRSARSGS